MRLAPAVSGSSGIRSFADVVEDSMDGVVSVTSRDNGDDEDDGDGSDPQDLCRFFFGDPDD